jgi:hypothetical protein
VPGPANQHPPRGQRFLAGRHRQLNMIETNNLHRCLLS